jgi:two-component system response regulator RegA
MVATSTWKSKQPRARAADTNGMSRTKLPSVLIVDDDEKIRAAISNTVERSWNLKALAAADFARGLSLWRQHRPKYAVIDLRLQGRSGIDLIAALRKEDKDARIVMITAYATIPLAVKAMRAGANDVRCKPFKAGELARCLLNGEVLPLDLDDSATPFSAPRLVYEHVARVVEEVGSVSEAARLLGWHRDTVRKWLKMTPPR